VRYTRSFRGARLARRRIEKLFSIGTTV
jgi:hypothetical protein